MSTTPCPCAMPRHECGLVVLTGGPGAGKTAVLEVIRHAFCQHVAVLPESATVLFGGGFPRHDTEAGLAYWPGGVAAACSALHVERDRELARYQGVIHLRSLSRGHGYDHSNPVRRESATEAAALDARILAAWEGHPRRVIVESQYDFLQKVARAVAAIREQVPPCCRAHRIPELGEGPTRA